MSLREEFKEILESVGVKDETVTVETYDPGDKKTHFELRNYQKMLLDFYDSLPPEIQKMELATIKAQIANGHDFKSFKE
jgi:hypothetical protein